MQTFDLSHFIDQDYFLNDGAQLYLMFQMLCYTLRRVGDAEEIISWKSKGLSAKKRTTSTTTNNSLSATIEWYGNSNFC